MTNFLNTIHRLFPWMSSVRSWMAWTLVAAFIALSVMGRIPSDKIVEIVMLVLTFYFLKDRGQPPSA